MNPQKKLLETNCATHQKPILRIQTNSKLDSFKQFIVSCPRFNRLFEPEVDARNRIYANLSNFTNLEWRSKPSKKINQSTITPTPDNRHVMFCLLESVFVFCQLSVRSLFIVANEFSSDLVRSREREAIFANDFFRISGPLRETITTWTHSLGARWNKFEIKAQIKAKLFELKN